MTVLGPCRWMNATNFYMLGSLPFIRIPVSPTRHFMLTTHDCWSHPLGSIPEKTAREFVKSNASMYTGSKKKYDFLKLCDAGEHYYPAVGESRMVLQLSFVSSQWSSELCKSLWDCDYQWAEGLQLLQPIYIDTQIHKDTVVSSVRIYSTTTHATQLSTQSALYAMLAWATDSVGNTVCRNRSKSQSVP